MRFYKSSKSLKDVGIFIGGDLNVGSDAEGDGSILSGEGAVLSLVDGELKGVLVFIESLLDGTTDIEEDFKVDISSTEGGVGEFHLELDGVSGVATDITLDRNGWLRDVLGTQDSCIISKRKSFCQSFSSSGCFSRHHLM